MRRNILLTLIAASLICHFIVCWYLIADISIDGFSGPIDNNLKESVLLWWTPFVTEERKIVCEKFQCHVTANRSYLHHPNTKGLLFYGSSLDPQDVPARRSSPELLWGLFHEESPRNVPLLTHFPALSLFNYSATFSRQSHVPLTLQFLPSLEDLISHKYFKSFHSKNNQRHIFGPIMYLQSDCSTPNNRDSYVAELMKHIKIDSYGVCLKNRNLTKSLNNGVNTMMADELLELVSQYKFSLAIENAICEDYITEKLWRPLIAGSVPLYIGSPSVEDWLPNKKSAIFPLKFKSPKDLAEYLLALENNEEEYNSYLDHKTKGIIDNANLVEKFTQIWPDELDSGGVHDFECLMCQKSYGGESSNLNTSHYNCPVPVSILTGKRNISNWWYWDYFHAACESQVFKDFVNEKTGSVHSADIDFALRVKEQCSRDLKSK